MQCLDPHLPGTGIHIAEKMSVVKQQKRAYACRGAPLLAVGSAVDMHAHEICYSRVAPKHHGPDTHDVV